MGLMRSETFDVLVSNFLLSSTRNKGRYFMNGLIFFPPFWGKYRKMCYLWNFRTCSLMQNTKTTRNNILLENVRFNFILSQNCILMAIHHYAPLLCTLYISESLTMAIKVQGVAGWSHTFQNRHSPRLCSEMSFSRRDWTAVLCWYPVSQDLQQTHPGTWIQARIAFPARLVRMLQVFSKLPVCACNLKSKAQLHSSCAVCQACNPPYISGCRRTSQSSKAPKLWKSLQISGKSRMWPAVSPHPDSRKLQRAGVHHGFLHQLPPVLLFFVWLTHYFSAYKMGTGVFLSL